MNNEQATEENKSKGIRVFVYGTLKNGHSNHTFLSKAEFLGRCCIEGDYQMVDLRWYPGLIRGASGEGSPRRIYGEVYRVDEDTLASLDILEGHPEYYRRAKVVTPWKNAWCYFMPADYGSKFAPVEDGVWNPLPDEREFVYGKRG